MKSWSALLMAALVMAAPGVSMAMDSQTLLSDPARYRVVFADDDEVVYADMDTVQSAQTRDYPSSIENTSFTMYAEVYKKKPSIMDFEKNDLVSTIQEYTATLHANKRTSRYSLKKTLRAVYDKEGSRLSAASFRGERSDADGEDLYFSLFRISRVHRAVE